LTATIVLADDDEDLRTVYALALRQRGYHILEAADGWCALDLIRRQRPALVLLDLWMPGLNGFEVLDQLRHDPAAGLAKVLMLSCRDDADSQLGCLSAGAVAYLVKGLPLSKLLEYVDRALSGAEVASNPS
jgi:DNA-binding response OmpR family regulator